jgi:DNA-binding response OmpR family regulator
MPGWYNWAQSFSTMTKGAEKRVLVVDDHPPTRAVMRSILESDKTSVFDVIEAATGADTLMAFESKGPFDLILLDVNLPDVDGFTICRALRRVDDKVPIVFVTGKTELKDFTAGREAGGDSYIVKPIARTALRSIVQLFTTLGRTNSGKPPKAEP